MLGARFHDISYLYTAQANGGKGKSIWTHPLDGQARYSLCCDVELTMSSEQTRNIKHHKVVRLDMHLRLDHQIANLATLPTLVTATKILNKDTTRISNSRSTVKVSLNMAKITRSSSNTDSNHTLSRAMANKA